MTMRDMHLGVRLPFETEEDRDDSEEILVRLLGVNCLINLQELRRHPELPPLYDSGVVYAEPDQMVKRRGDTPAARLKLVRLLREMGTDPETALMILRMVRGVEVFLDVLNLYQRGRGDCNELVPVRVAELWRAGRMDATPWLSKQRNDRGGWTYHATIKYLADGSSEDPSKILGMDCAPGERLEEIRKNTERWATHMVAARRMVEAGAPARALGQKIDLMGWVPSDGRFSLKRDRSTQVGRAGEGLATAQLGMLRPLRFDVMGGRRAA